MLEELLTKKYKNYLGRLDLIEKPNSLVLSTIVIKQEFRNEGYGSKIMNDIILYADKTGKIIALTPSPDLGGNKNKLIEFYKRFGFVPNKGKNKDFQFREAMIRYPKITEMKSMVKQLLREGLLGREEKDLKSIADFVNFTKDFLNISDDIKIELAYERVPQLKTTAFYDTSGAIMVYVKDRAVIDICRSIAHELVHHKQMLEKRLLDTSKDGEDGSPIENEANAVAGIIIRKWGRLHPQIYI